MAGRYFIIKTSEGYLKSAWNKFTNDPMKAKRYTLGGIRGMSKIMKRIINKPSSEVLEVTQVYIPATKEIRKDLSNR